MRNIDEKAMLVKLKISQWTIYKHDRKANTTVEREYKISGDGGNYNKILSRCNAVKQAKKIATAARAYHYAMTLPWNDDGSRILPSVKFKEYSEQMRKFKQDMEHTTSQFDYDEIIKEAKARLGDLFNEEDYPKDLSFKFRMDFELYPVPNVNDFRVDINHESNQQIREHMENNIKRKIGMAHADLYRRLVECVSHVVDKLSDSDAVFRNSLIHNVCKLCSLIPDLNINDDADLNKIVEELNDKICNVDPDTLRDNDRFRKKKADDAKNILDVLEKKWKQN